MTNNRPMGLPTPRTDMLYAIIATDIANSLDQRLAARPAHLARLSQLQSEGRLVLAGPHPAIDSNDPGAAQSWADADPYRAAGVYASVLVKPFKQVLP